MLGVCAVTHVPGRALGLNSKILTRKTIYNHQTEKMSAVGVLKMPLALVGYAYLAI